MPDFPKSIEFLYLPVRTGKCYFCKRISAFKDSSNKMIWSCYGKMSLSQSVFSWTNLLAESLFKYAAVYSTLINVNL